ncbi:ATP-binding protein [Sphingomonas sp.]|uniref:ATP-binding protein n=1 Tax=Sphingomonas sp. TaxID=28214 RepID=UPI001B1D291E|nr:ATP-binding protein [Sphingomonas sp.]MBO9712463.1 ATP-binding protein [Sphingomonas sp.]
MPDSSPKLFLKFHGRILDSLGIQMYQSPVAAVAELIANAWDADAKSVAVTLPDRLDGSPELLVVDTGRGMTFAECQDFYLNVGRNRRVEAGAVSAGGRPVLGRKGIGKFAGFGIADVMRVETISGESGEKTVFELDIRKLRSDAYVDVTPEPVTVIEHLDADAARIPHQGTTIKLTELKLQTVRNPEPFAKSMSRRFLLASQADDFIVTVNGLSLPEDVEPFSVQFDFPRDYQAGERPAGMNLDGDWGVEELSEGRKIRWRVRFSTTPIESEEFRGVSVFCGVKIAQNPFFFNLSGGLGGQHGQQYLTGKVVADYLDQLGGDVITTERQRINWEEPVALELQEWGQVRLKELLVLWKERRAQEKVNRLDARVEPFAQRLENLPPTERKIVRTALLRVAQVEAIDDEQFGGLAQAILTAWEGGRLRGLIDDISRMDGLAEGALLHLLAEAQVIGALHMAEVVETRIGIIQGLERRIADRDLENAVRDYIAVNPWLIGPRWETFRKEISLNSFIVSALEEAGITKDPDWQGRMDLVLRSGHELVVVEFMRPGLTIDRDHINRFRHYVQVLKTRISGNSDLKISHVSGLLVADHLNKKADILEEIASLGQSSMFCLEWSALLGQAKAQWMEFMAAVTERAPDDPRVQAIRADTKGSDENTTEQEPLIPIESIGDITSISET